MASATYISMKEAASLLGVSPSTLRNWDKTGRLKAIRNPVNRYRLYNLQDVISLQREISLFPLEKGAVDGATPGEGNAAPSPSQLKRVVRALHRTSRDSEGNSSIVERFDEITKLLYCKIYDERYAEEAGMAPAFAIDTGSTPKNVADRVRRLFAFLGRGAKAELFPKRFSEIKLGEQTIYQMAEAMAPFSFAGAPQDLKGYAYEELIRNTFDKGDNQQFFTPRTVVEFMVQMLSGQLRGRVCDPACGTGGFLIFVSDFCRASGTRHPERLLGFEIDERLAWVAGINLDVHGAQSFHVECLPNAGSLGAAVDTYLGELDLIITNPPFGSDLAAPEALCQFALGKGRKSRRRGVLFIERSLQLVKPGGLVAIIIDEGVLNGPSNSDVRKLICEVSEPFAIVSLPETAFMPYASVKASILFLEKRGGRRKRLVQSRGTFFARTEVVGRKPNGDPLYRHPASAGRLELDSDLPGVLAAWRRLTVEGRLPDDTTLNGAEVFCSRIPEASDRDFGKDGYRLDLPYHHPSRQEAVRALKDSPYRLAPLAELCGIRNDMVVPSKEFQDEEFTYVSLANIEPFTGACSPTVATGSMVRSAVRRFQAGDILFSKMRPELRKVCLVPDSLEAGYSSSECLVLAPSKRPDGTWLMLPELLSLLLRTDLVYGQVVHLVTGIGRPRLSKAAVMNIRIPSPPLGEQKRLLDLFERSREAAEALVGESLKALRTAKEITTKAQAQLVQDVLRGKA